MEKMQKDMRELKKKEEDSFKYFTHQWNSMEMKMRKIRDDKFEKIYQFGREWTHQNKKEMEQIRDDIVKMVFLQNNEYQSEMKERYSYLMELFQRLEKCSYEIQYKLNNEMETWKDKNDVRDEVLQTLKEGVHENNAFYLCHFEKIEKQIQKNQEMIHELTYRIHSFTSLFPDMFPQMIEEWVAYRAIYCHPYVENPNYEHVRVQIQNYSSMEYPYERYEEQMYRVYHPSEKLSRKDSNK
jgi:hypothetical protein